MLKKRRAGSSCLLLPGTYHVNATIEIVGLHGTFGAPYTIGAAGEAGSVTFDGRAEVNGPWKREDGANRMLKDGTTVATQHWSAAWPEGLPEPWQLFVDDEMQTVARWPNARCAAARVPFALHNMTTAPLHSASSVIAFPQLGRRHRFPE